MADETYYSLLEISETVSAAEIKTAYLRLIREVHPDRLANAPDYWRRQAEEKSKEINEAYAVLSSREKRTLYDAQLAAYRRSRSTTNRQSSSQTTTPPKSSAQKQGSQTSSHHSATQQQQKASTSTPSPNAHSQPLNQPFVSSLSAGHRLLFALVGCLFALGAANLFWDSTSIGEGVCYFLLAGSLLFGIICLYQSPISRILAFVGLKRPRHQLGIVISAIVLGLLFGKNRDTHFRGADDQSAISSQISQVKIINGSLSTTEVSGMSNEKYPAAYNFTAYIQNNSTVRVSFIRMKIRIFDCQEMGSPSSQTSHGISYQSGILDPSPPSNCQKIGEEEEDDFPRADPGQTLGFANFYFPNHPQGILRWNYAITKMDTQNVAASLPIPGQPSPNMDAQLSGSDASPLAPTSGTNGKAMHEDARDHWRKFLAGKWVGKYTCAQGVTGLTLTIVDTADGDLSAVFDFYPVPGGYRFPEGSYSGVVVTGPNGIFEFKPQKWIYHPATFIAVGLTGHYLAKEQRLQGQVTGEIGCTSFDLSRQPSQVPLTPVTLAPPTSVPNDAPNMPASNRGSAQHPDASNSSRLSSIDRASIESACSGARLVQGAAAYHRCLDTQVEELAQHPDAPDLSRLASVDRASIESACSGARLVQGAAAYHGCLDTQVEELAQHPDAPDLSRLTSVDRASIESACSGARLTRGAAVYHRCLDTQVEELAQHPDAPDLSKLSSVDRASIESACSGARLTRGAAAYHRCLRDQLSALLSR